MLPVKFPDDSFSSTAGTLEPHHPLEVGITGQLVYSTEDAPPTAPLAQGLPHGPDADQAELLRLRPGGDDHVEEELVLLERLREVRGLDPAPGSHPGPALDDEVGQVSVVVVDHPEQRVPLIT